jgi:hypothetical protein
MVEFGLQLDLIDRFVLEDEHVQRVGDHHGPE